MNRSKCVPYKTHIGLCNWLLLIILVLSACGTLEVGIESSRPRFSSRAQDTGVVPTPSATASVSNVLVPATAQVAPVSSSDGESLYLGINQVQGLAFVDVDTLWAATTGGAVRWDLATGSHVQYTTADGVASNYVTDVALAPDGSLWFATLGGVSRFNHGAWANYMEADGLVSDAVQAIAVTQDGTVWAGTTEGISRFDGVAWATYFPGDRAWDIAIAPDGAVWFASDGAGLRRYTPSDDAWMTYTMKDAPYAPGVKTVAAAPDGTIWVYLGYDQVYRFDGETWHPAYTAQGQWVCDVAFETDGTPWIATGDGYRAYGVGLATLEDGTWRYVGRAAAGVAEEGLASNSVRVVAIGPMGQVAAGTTRGVSVYRDWEWQTLHHGPAINQVTSVAVTPDGAAWFGFGNATMPPAGGGVSRFEVNDERWATFDQSTGFPIHDNVRVLEADAQGRVWAAAGCELATYADGAWRRVAGCEDLDGNVIDLAFGPEALESSSGGVWIATDFNVYRFDGRAWVMWEHLLPTAIAVMADGTVLIGQSPLEKGGVWAYADGRWQPMEEGPPCVTELVVDGSGTVWASGCEAGDLHRWRDGRWETITVADGLLAGRIIDLAVSTTGEVWVITVEGIGHLEPEGWVVQERLWAWDVYEMALAPDRSIWLATSQGALRIPEPPVINTPTPSPSTPALLPTPSPMPTPTAIPVASTTPDTPAPQVLSFAAERVEAELGEGIALTWEAAGEQATICPLIGDRAVGCRCLFGVPLAGSHMIRPQEIVGNYDGFRLVVESGGIRTVRYVPLAVKCPDMVAAWFFDGQPPAICPRNPPFTSYAAIQRFEHGLMIWVEASDAYYVLFDHHAGISDNPQNSSSLTSLRVIQGPLALKPGASADNRVAETPPPNRFEPVSGFGLVWRGEVLGGEGIRDALGWAVESEYGFDTVYQCAISCDSYWDCYLQGPDGEIFHFYLLLHVGRFWEVVK